MEAVRLFKDKEMFFIPHSFDYRGRMYPVPSFLTMQCTDFGKSLLKFHESAKLTSDAEDWLSFQVATTYGLDKATIKDRLEWTATTTHSSARLHKILLVVFLIGSQLRSLGYFLAACDEYYHCCIKRDRDYTALPVAVDATCSGLQILAGLCRDARTASLVNVLPGERPADAYAPSPSTLNQTS